jgi:polyisoprenoid-binding protein YceI
MKKLFLLFVAALAFSSLAFAADTYTIDPAHTSANFSVKHLGLSNVRGRFATVSGTILFDEKATEKSSVTVLIKTDSINTDVAMRDKDLNSPRYFDTATYPEIKFTSTSIRKVGGDKYVAVGNLTIRDVTKQVEIPFTLAQGKSPKGDPRLGAEGSLTINRLDYKVGSTIPAAAVGTDIKIDLSVEAQK